MLRSDGCACHHNSIASACLVSGVLLGDVEMLGQGMTSDKIVEVARGPLIPGFLEVKAAAMAAGALGCTISGETHTHTLQTLLVSIPHLVHPLFNTALVVSCGWWISKLHECQQCHGTQTRCTRTMSFSNREPASAPHERTPQISSNEGGLRH